MAHEKILIIDGDAHLLDEMRMSLDTAGFDVHTATNGTEGLRMVKRIHPDLIIIDALADQTEDGFQVSMLLRNPTPASEYVA